MGGVVFIENDKMIAPTPPPCQEFVVIPRSTTPRIGFIALGALSILVSTSLAQFTQEQRDFWAFRKPELPKTPAVEDRAWVQSPIDAFILAKLEERGLRPAAAAERQALIRRATFDLLGLPPTPEEVSAFLADDQPDAFARVVDRLLASPHYGERWGRHWLDVARYSDSNGMDENLAQTNAWRYRDYVISSFNHDLPYDRFVREQIAGDLLPAEADEGRNRQRWIATGFLALGPKMLAEDDPVKMEMDIIDEQVDTIGRAFMGLTLGCARCHDHKFDPITMADYYALAGIFKSTRTMENFRVVAQWYERPLATAAEIANRDGHRRKIEEKKAAIRDAVQAARRALQEEAREKLPEYLAAAREINHRNELLRDSKRQTGEALVPGNIELLARERKLNPQFLKQWAGVLRKSSRPLPMEDILALSDHPDGPFAVRDSIDEFFPREVQDELKQRRAEQAALEKSLPVLPEAMGATEGQATNLRIHLRGNHLTQDREAPRGFPSILISQDAPPLAIENKQSGRLQLADWLTRPDHPLTARVLVNRLWRHHFGMGLVRSPDNFGKLGDLPIHRELLDWLAVRFTEEGWSIKTMQRIIMLSSTYQMSCEPSEKAVLADPDNRLHWRMPHQRLEAEAIRDALLQTGGQLDPTMGGSLMVAANRAYVTSTANQNYERYDSNRRSVYLPVIRSALYDFFQAFDFPDPSTPNGDRATTTVAPQALFMLNSKLVEQQSRRLAEALIGQPGLDDAGRVTLAYRRAYGRGPTQAELARSLQFIHRLVGAAISEGGGPEESKLRAWQGLGRALFSASEFITLD
jgi:hypothetical protein